MKILFVGVFDMSKQSTNTSQLLAFKKLGHDVVGYNYRNKAAQKGNTQRDADLTSIIEDREFDLVVFSKCNLVDYEVFKKASLTTKTCLWFMDPLKTYNEEMRKKTALVDYFCCDKENVLKEALVINNNSFRVCEGFDQDVDKPHDVEKEHDVSFIGNIYGDRAKMIEGVAPSVKIVSNAYGSKHAIEVSRSRINLNFCTDKGASDRVYKVMAAGGFLLSNDWKNRNQDFINGRDCVIFSDIADVNKKIDFYLKNPEMRNQISKHGQQAVQKFNRLNWAKKIVELSTHV